MHELSVTQSILEISLEYAQKNQANHIVAIHLQVGEVTDFDDEWIQRYFDFVSKGTLAERAPAAHNPNPSQAAVPGLFFRFSPGPVHLEQPVPFLPE